MTEWYDFPNVKFSKGVVINNCLGGPRRLNGGGGGKTFCVNKEGV